MSNGHIKSIKMMKRGQSNNWTLARDKIHIKVCFLCASNDAFCLYIYSWAAKV